MLSINFRGGIRPSIIGTGLDLDSVLAGNGGDRRAGGSAGPAPKRLPGDPFHRVPDFHRITEVPDENDGATPASGADPAELSHRLRASLGSAPCSSAAYGKTSAVAPGFEAEASSYYAGRTSGALGGGSAGAGTLRGLLLHLQRLLAESRVHLAMGMLELLLSQACLAAPLDAPLWPGQAAGAPAGGRGKDFASAVSALAQREREGLASCLEELAGCLNVRDQESSDENRQRPLSMRIDKLCKEKGDTPKGSRRPSLVCIKETGDTPKGSRHPSSDDSAPAADARGSLGAKLSSLELPEAADRRQGMKPRASALLNRCNSASTADSERKPLGEQERRLSMMSRLSGNTVGTVGPAENSRISMEQRQKASPTLADACNCSTPAAGACAPPAAGPCPTEIALPMGSTPTIEVTEADAAVAKAAEPMLAALSMEQSPFATGGAASGAAGGAAAAGSASPRQQASDAAAAEPAQAQQRCTSDGASGSEDSRRSSKSSEALGSADSPSIASLGCCPPSAVPQPITIVMPPPDTLPPLLPQQPREPQASEQEELLDLVEPELLVSVQETQEAQEAQQAPERLPSHPPAPPQPQPQLQLQPHSQQQLKCPQLQETDLKSADGSDRPSEASVPVVSLSQRFFIHADNTMGKGQQKMRKGLARGITNMWDKNLEEDRATFLAMPSNRFIIHPSCNFRMIWDCSSLFFIMLEAILIPLGFCFEIYPHPVFLWGSTFFFVPDILLNTLTGFYHNGIVVMRQNVIVKRYLCSWGPVDFISTTPWDSILGQTNLAASSAFLRFAKIGKLLRVLRLLRVLKLKSLLQRVEDMFSSYALLFFLAFAKTLIFFLLFCHWTACVWGWLGDADPAEPAYDRSTCEPDGPCEGGIGLGGSPWRRRYGLTNSPGEEQYLTALHFATGLLTGAELPLGAGYWAERIFTITMTVVGFLVCSMVLSQIVVVMHRLNQDQSEYLEETRTMREFMVSRGMPRQLQTKVKRYLEYQFKSRKIVRHNHDVMMKLSPFLRQEIQEFMNNSVLEQHPFFKLMEPTLFSAVCGLCQSVLYAPGDIVLNRDRLSSCIIFLVRGQLRIQEVREGYNVHIKPPAWIGDRGLFEATRRHHTVVCAMHSELLTVQQEDLIELVETFPASADYIKNYCERVMRSEPDVIFCEYCGGSGHDIECCEQLTHLATQERIAQEHKLSGKYDQNSFDGTAWLWNLVMACMRQCRPNVPFIGSKAKRKQAPSAAVSTDAWAGESSLVVPS